MPLRHLRLLSAVLALFLLGCEPSTEPTPIPLVETAGTFRATLTGGLSETVQGSATFAPYSESSGLYVQMETPNGSLRINVGPGVLAGAPYFEFPVGKYPISGLPGVRLVDIGVTVVGTDLVPTAYFGTLDGTLEIVESTPGKILARFDIDAWYAEGGATDRIRARGSFWAIP